MKFKITFLPIASIAMLLAFSGCNKGDDNFINPNLPLPEQVPATAMLTAIEVSTFNTYESDLVRRASIYVQQNTGIESQALKINDYNITEQDFANSWTQAYQALLTCKQLNEQYGAANPYYSGIVDILAVMNWGILSDMWGDIPFSDAVQGGKNNYMSKYDKQQAVFEGMQLLLDGAIVKLSLPSSQNESFPPGTDDLAFGGDTDAWIRVAYSLKARYLNRLSKKASYNADAILAALGKGIKSSSEDFVSIHTNTAGGFNQWFDFQNNRYHYILASLPFVDSLKLRPTDLRIYSYFDSTDLGDVVGSPVDTPISNASQWGNYLAKNGGVGIHLISFTEMKFIEAEVKTRQGNPSAADALNIAIKESCKNATDGVYDGADIAKYTSATINVSRVIYEKWLALFGSPEPYNDYRRTGYPALIPNPAGIINVIPKRNLTPSSERTGNPNAPTPAITDPVWFAE